MKTLQDKVAVITGGNSGIGYATAKEMIAQGATVIITGRRRDAIEKAAAAIGAIPFVADQANLQDTDALSAFVKERFGKTDILFINAGISGTGSPEDSIENTSAEAFDTMMNINFRGAYFMLNKFIPLLGEGASVVLLSSIVASMHKANSSVYQASKAAVNSIAKTAANELASRKIRVNMISPGPTRTQVLSKSGLDEQAVENIFEQLAGMIPLGKVGIPEDVAKMVVYLSGDAATYITGSEFVIDGGFTL